MQKQISQAVQTALYGSRRVNITFKLGAEGFVYYLLEMNRNGAILLKDGDPSTLMNVMELCDWGKNLSRTVTINLGKKFDENFFIDRMHDALEKIEVVK